MRKKNRANDESVITEKKISALFSLAVWSSMSAPPFLLSGGQLDRLCLFLSPLILCAVQHTDSQQKICTGNCKTQSCPDNKKFKRFQPRPAVSQLSYPQLQSRTFPSFVHREFCFFQAIMHSDVNETIDACHYEGPFAATSCNILACTKSAKSNLSWISVEWK